MRVITRRNLLLLLGATLLAPQAHAHHGTGISYDVDKPFEVQAIVREFVYANPHCTMFFDVIEKDGSLTRWDSELTNHPARMARLGWTKARTEAALKPGTKVTLTLARSKAGGNAGLVMQIIGDNGEQIAGRGLQRQ